MSGTEPRRAVSGDEVDAHSRFRHYLRWRPGQRAAVKRSTNRRERRERQADAEQQVRELGRRGRRMNATWTRQASDNTPTPEPDIEAETSGDMARTMAALAVAFAFAAVACLPLAHITWAPAAAFTVSAVWVAGLGVHDRKKANR